MPVLTDEQFRLLMLQSLVMGVVLVIILCLVIKYLLYNRSQKLNEVLEESRRLKDWLMRRAGASSYEEWIGKHPDFTEKPPLDYLLAIEEQLVERQLRLKKIYDITNENLLEGTVGLGITERIRNIADLTRNRLGGIRHDGEKKIPEGSGDRGLDHRSATNW